MKNNKISVTEYRKREKKGGQKVSRVYACPECWYRLPEWEKEWKTKSIRLRCYFAGCKNSTGDSTFDSKDAVAFPSKAEHDAGLMLMEWQKAGKITGLVHHQRFELIPERWEKAYDGSPPIERHARGFLNWYVKYVEIKYYKPKTPGWIKIDAVKYEPDFIYWENEVLQVVEVKNLGRKRNKKTGEMEEKIFFKPPQTLGALRKKVEFLLQRHDVSFFIYASGKWFQFDAKWKLQEVTYE